MKVDFEKVGVIASYFADNTKKLYITKLLKLFYYLDFISYKVRGSSVSNDVYLKLPYGPVPSAIKNEIDIILSLKNTPLGKEFKKQLLPYIKLERDVGDKGNLVVSASKDYNLRKLSNSELELMKCIAETFKNTTGKVLTNQTHREKPWLSTSTYSIISYDLAEGLDVEKILPNFTSK